MSTSRSAVSAAFTAVALSCACSPALAQGTVGLVADRTNNIVVFDAEKDAVLGTIPIPNGVFLFDCEIAPSRGLGFVADFLTQEIWVVDLRARPPALANGGRPIAVTTFPLDLSMTPDERHLIAADGNGPGEPLSVVDLETLQEIGIWSFGPNANPSSVQTCDDGSVLVTELTSPTTTIIRRFTIDAAGALTDTGESLPDTVAPDVNNIACASSPFCRKPIAVYTSRRANQRLGTIAVDGLAPLDTTAPTGPFGIDIALGKYGLWCYVRTNESTEFGPSGAGRGFVDAFLLNPFSGDILAKLFTIDLDRRTGTTFGAEQMALSPDGRKLYVSGLALPEIRVYHARSGRQIGTVTGAGLGIPTGIAIADVR